jgi:hypothetical protein
MTSNQVKMQHNASMDSIALLRAMIKFIELSRDISSQFNKFKLSATAIKDESLRALLSRHSTDKCHRIDTWIEILKKDDILAANGIYDMESNKRIDDIKGATAGLKDVLRRAYAASTASKNITPVPGLQPIGLAQYDIYHNNLSAFQEELRVAPDKEATTLIVTSVCKHIEKILREAAASNGMADGTGRVIDKRGRAAFGPYLHCPALKANLSNNLIGQLRKVCNLRNELSHPVPFLEAERYCDTDRGLEVCGVGLHLLDKLRPPSCVNDAFTSSSSSDSDATDIGSDDETLIAEDRKIHHIRTTRYLRID